MRLRLLRAVLVFAGAAALAACEGTMGTMDDTRQAGSADQGSDVSTSGVGDGSITGAPIPGTDADEAAAGAGGASDGFQGHPLDDPKSTLANRTIYFEYDSIKVLESERAAIEAHARYLSEHPGASITLEGHADERGTREYNVALGEERAIAIRQIMTLLGAAGQQIRTISYGEERPAAVGHDESAWRLNRRVEIIYRTRE